MKVFISWSGERSKAIAEALRDWLPDVIHYAEPWMSAADIEKGARWSSDIANQLEQTRVGLICLTPENLEAPWILFEAGALSRTLEETYVCTYLFDLEPADLEGPLVQFQATRADREDTRKLVHTINRALGDEARPEARVDKAFEAFWPQLEKRLTNIPDIEEEPESKRPERDILVEVLELVRALTRESQKQYGKAAELDYQLRTLKLLLEEDALEAFQIEEISKRVLKRFAEALEPELKTRAEERAARSETGEAKPEGGTEDE